VESELDQQPKRPHKVLFNPRQVNFVRTANLITNVCITAVYQIHSQGVRQQKKPFSRRWWRTWNLSVLQNFWQFDAKNCKSAIIQHLRLTKVRDWLWQIRAHVHFKRAEATSRLLLKIRNVSKVTDCLASTKLPTQRSIE